VFARGVDSIDGTMKTLRKTQAPIRFVQVRRDMSAALMARGRRNRTASLCVCLATSGRGGIHSRNGRCDAKHERVADQRPRLFCHSRRHDGQIVPLLTNR
jgi:thiamine pyrophosphate-dependent acetolactate synthase large subunit-like protein